MAEYPDLSAWVGKTERREDVATPALVARLAATLDHDGRHWTASHVPPLGHWLCFLPDAAQSALDIDGHPRRGGFLPPVPLPRRMWAGSRVRFLGPLPIGAPLHRVSTIASIAEKTGRSGRMVFVTVEHVIASGGDRLIVEEQDLVYREAPGAGSAPPAGQPMPDATDWQASLVPDAPLLFRYSALTFNAHRIHYDLAYATEDEGHAGLVVQGPLAATLLLDRHLQHGGKMPHTFRFRALLPLIAGDRLTLAGSGNLLWAGNGQGLTAMQAEIS